MATRSGNQECPPSQGPLLACDGQGLKRLVRAAVAWLDQQTELINRLNVFPVPDGDTGTNMLLTMRSAYQEIATSPEEEVGAIAHKVAQGALMGARGNSGVILSQIWRGIAQRLENLHTFDAQTFAEALATGAQVAYKGVIQPVEGTILTVIRETAEVVRQIVSGERDLRVVLEKAAEAARASVARTPELLPVLKEANVVDAGGQGLYVILEGMARYVRGEPVDEGFRITADHAEPHPQEAEEEYGYDVQYILRGTDLDVDAIRADIAAMGTSALVVGDRYTVKVHVHTPNPGDPLNYGAKLGSLSRVIVENLQEQYQDFVLQRGPTPQTTAEAPEIAVVAVAPGEGIAHVFESLGASAVVQGGQTMNPSIEELIKAIDGTESEKVILLPNNSNVILAAQQAQALSDRTVRVVSTKTVPQGIAAMLAFTPQGDLEEIVEAMEEAAQEVRTGEVTIATRDVELNGLEINQGTGIGLIDGELVCAGDDLETLLLDLLERMKANEAEVITLYAGEPVSWEEATRMRDRVIEQYPMADVELIDGGQPHYHYILSVE